MSWSRRWTSDLSLALTGVAASAGLVCWSASRAIHLEPLPSASLVSAERPLPAFTHPADARSDLLRAAVDLDPFNQERRRPAIAFRLPGEGVADSAVVHPPGATLTLIGTAVIPGGGFAMCQWAGESPKLVRLGERVGTYTLKTLEQGKATFLTSSGTTLEVRVPKAGS